MNTKKLRTFISVLILLLLFTTCGFAENGIRIDGQIGFDGVVLQGGAWRLTLNIENHSGKDINGYISVNIAKNVYDDYDEMRLPVKLEANHADEFYMDVFPLAPQNILDVRLFSEDGSFLAFTTVSVKKTIATDAMTIGVWGEQELANALECHDKIDEYGRKENVETILLNAKSFPENEAEAMAFSLLVVDGHSWDELSLKQQNTLIAWLKNGGYLVVGTESKENSEKWIAAATLSTDKSKIRSSTEDTVRTILSDSAEADEERELLKNVRLLAGGHAIICGFSLSSTSLLQAARQEQIWRRVLAAIDGQGYTFTRDGRSNVKYSQTLNTLERVNKGNGILPIAWILGVYVALIGIGMYIILKRRDASKWLWAAIPLCTAGCAAAIGLWSIAKKPSAPAAAQTLIIHYDEDGDVDAEEQVLLSYAGQKRRTISTQNGDEIEPVNNYQRFYSYGEENVDMKNMELQNVVTLGEDASIELKEKATWVERNLLIHRKNLPEGKMTSSAWMDSDGLHAEIYNETDMTLKNAVLITSWGYACAEQIAPGETKTFFLPREKESKYSVNLNDGVLIPEGEALLFPAPIYSVERMYVYPELAEGKELNLTSDEEENRQLLQSKVSCCPTYYNGNWAQCSLVAESLDVECSALLIDGEPIDHTAKNTIIVCNIPIRKESPNGYLYTGEILKYEVEEDSDGMLHLGAKKDLGYVYGDGIHMIGYDLSTVDFSKIQTIRFDSAFGVALNNEVTLEIYDHGSNEWIPIFSDRRGFEDLALDVDKMNGIIGENGELFLRIQMKNTNDYGGVYMPSITVEGGNVQ